MTQEIYNQLHSIINDILVHHIELDKVALSKHGLRRIRFYVMRHIYNQPNISISHLSALSLADMASVSRMLRSLERDGLVTRKADELDRRSYYISLTEKGEKIVEEANATLQVDIISRFGDVTEDDLERIASTLTLLRDHFVDYGYMRDKD